MSFASSKETSGNFTQYHVTDGKTIEMDYIHLLTAAITSLYIVNLRIGSLTALPTVNSIALDIQAKRFQGILKEIL